MEKLQIDISHEKSMKLIEKHPKLSWRQNKFLIYIEIQAKDCDKFEIQIENDFLSIFIEYPHHVEKTSIQFFDLIAKDISSWDESGGFIRIRLPKQIVGLWQRLTLDNDSNQFITKNPENLDFIEHEIKMIEMESDSDDSDY